MNRKFPPDWQKLPPSLRHHPDFLHLRIDMVERRISHLIPDWFGNIMQWLLTVIGFLVSLYPGFFTGFLSRLFH